MKRILISLVALLVVAGLYVSTLISVPIPPNHQVVIGGEVLTMAADDRIAEGVSVRDGIIEQLGTTAEISTLITDSTAIVDLAGRTLFLSYGHAGDTNEASTSGLEPCTAKNEDRRNVGA